jgi:ABC-type Zn uptake system ZnuABC Zn-binding protein ZnuA
MRISNSLFSALVLSSLFVVSASPPKARADGGTISVLTTTTDLAEIVKAVGGDKVSVRSLCKGPEDPHFLDARPSFIRMGGEADLLVVIGMELEVGYIPLILRDGSNPKIKPGSPGYLDASARIRKLQVPEGGQVSRAMGDVHPNGNPHYMLDPANAGVVAEDVAKALSVLAPDSAKAFMERAGTLRTAISELLLGKPPADNPRGKREGGLLDRFKPYKGASIVSYHDDMIYVAQRYGLEVLGTLEPKPGVPPSAEHMAQLATQAKAANVKAVLYDVFEPSGPVTTFAQEVGATPVLIAHMPSATTDATDLLATYKRNAELLLAALAKGTK